MGVGAHAMDETMGNPLKTRLSKTELYAIGFVSLTASIGIGLYYVFELSLLLLPFVVAESFFAITYNLETFQGRFHSMPVFVISWGALPLLAAYFVNSLSLDIQVLMIAICAAILTYVQRTLSLQARRFRRVREEVESLRFSSGSEVPVSTHELISPAEQSLKALTAFTFLLAIALILFRI